MIDPTTYRKPDLNRPDCTFCESCGDEGDQCSHADYLNHFETHDEWSENPSLVIAMTLSNDRCDASGYFDDEDGKVDQELAYKVIDALETAGWSLTKENA